MRIKICIILFLYLSSVTIQGCLDASESDYEKQVREADQAIETFLSSNDIEAEKLTSGVQVEILKENENGKELKQDHVAGILYSITHLEGEHVIEAYTDTSNPVRFSNSYDLSRNYHALYPAGLNYEIGNMKQGEKFRFYVPSYLAFGNYSHDNLFDSFSHFIIDVDLVEIKTEEEIYDEEVALIQRYINEDELDTEPYPNGLHHLVIEANNGKFPHDNSEVMFHFTRKYLDGTVIESSESDDPVLAKLNQNQLVSGLEDGIKLMREGEKAKLIMPSKLAFGKSIQVIPQQLREDWAEEDRINPVTKPYSPIIYEVELLQIN